MYKIVESNGNWYAIPEISAHRPACQKVLAGKVHESETLEVIKRHSKGNVVIHAGTFFGDMLPYLSSWFQTVLAFEPNPVSYKAANICTVMNDLDNVNLINEGLSNAPTSMGIVTKEKGVELGGASYLVDGLGVKVNTIDYHAKGQQVDVIHLDVEKHERKALEGALSVINRCKPVLILETPPKKWIAENLPGYKQTGVCNFNAIFEYVK